MRGIPADFSAAKAYPLSKLPVRSRRFVSFIAQLSGSDFYRSNLGGNTERIRPILWWTGMLFSFPEKNFLHYYKE